MRTIHLCILMLVISSSLYGATSNAPRPLQAPSPMIMGNPQELQEDHGELLVDEYDIFPYPPGFPDDLKDVCLPCICAYGLLRIMYDEMQDLMGKTKHN